jgi:hypothetical protein
MSVRHLVLLAVAALIGCAHGTRASGSRPSEIESKAHFLAAAEMVAEHADLTNAYDAIARLRPNWFGSRGVSTFGSGNTEFAVVFVDGQRHGNLDMLRKIPAYHVKDFRYYDVTQAGATFGIQAGMGGVIEVRMKVGPR